MKVILLQEIKGQGGEGDVVEVKRGYAVNFLFPKKLAIEANKGNLKQLELRKHNIAKREAERLDSADKIQAALADKVLVIGARVGEEGQLFGSVTTHQIADKLAEELGLEIDRRKIDLHAPIKTAGEHSVTVTIYRDIKALLTINVVSDAELVKEEPPAAPAVEGEADEAAADEAVEAEVADETVEADEAAADEAAEEAADEPAEAEPTEEAAVEAADEVAEEVADDSAEEAAVEPAEPAEDEVAEEAAEEAKAEEPAEEAKAEEPAEESAEEPEEEAADEPAETDEPAEDSEATDNIEDALDEDNEQ